MTATHPSIYDDFDAIMAAAHLLSADGASTELGAAAWDAAYDYYGPISPASPTPTRCSHARSPGPNTASASTAVWKRRWCKRSTPPTALRWRPPGSDRHRRAREA